MTNPLTPLARDLSKIRFYDEFAVDIEKEIDVTTTRIEGDKTIEETVKTKTKVAVPFGFKRPSRAESQDADIERSVWETKFVTAGILPRALLLKTYANYGGILSDNDRERYLKMQKDLLDVQDRLAALRADKDNAEIDSLKIRFLTLRQEILDFEQEQSAFFSNTAEAKARDKLIEWLAVHMTYYRPIDDKGEPGEWTPFFAGKTTEEKLAALDEVVESDNELWAKAANRITFMATIVASGGDPKAAAEFFKADVDEQ
jgi:hypothetical protein